MNRVSANDFRKIKKRIASITGSAKPTVDVEERRPGVVTFTGKLDEWSKADLLCHYAGKRKSVRGVVNLIEVNGKSLAYKANDKLISQGREKGLIGKADLVIVGGGVTGCGIARELSKYKLDIILVEKEADVACGASKANNGMIHSGNAVIPHKLMAKLNVEGNALYPKWAEELGFKFDRVGSYVCSYDKNDWYIPRLASIAGKINKVSDMHYVDPDIFMKKEPMVSIKPRRCLYTPTTAFVDGYEVVVALAENAASNGVKFMLESQVVDIDMEDGKIASVVTDKGIIQTKMVINAAGVYADEIAAMADDQFYSIHPRKGTILIFDKNAKGVDTCVNAYPKVRAKNSKGGGMQRTVHGNQLWGPTAEEIVDKEDTSVTKEEIETVFNNMTLINKNMKMSDIITYFAGVRAATYKEDFIIEASEKSQGFIHVAGIQSPGLASAPAIAKMVEGIVKEEYLSIFEKNLEEKEDWNPKRERPLAMEDLTDEEKDKLIKKNPAYGRIICRCESITEGEIVSALHSPLPVLTIDGLKRRTRVTEGRCQGGFCEPKILEIMNRELGKDVTTISKNGHDSFIIKGKIRSREEDNLHA